MASNYTDSDQYDPEDDQDEFSSSDDSGAEDCESDSEAEPQEGPSQPPSAGGQTTNFSGPVLSQTVVLLFGTPDDVAPCDPSLAAPSAHFQGEPCKYYNRGHCRDGQKCRYLHFCKYSLRGNCRYGDSCRLAHPRTPRYPTSGRHGDREGERRSSSREKKLEDGRPYQWQLNSGDGWRNLANQHILEAQYSLPQVKGIQIYNTPFGAVSIDFRKMRVLGKRLRVRRLEAQQAKWIWYYKSSHGWIKYGKKDSKGQPGPVQSSEIEGRFQNNPNSSFTFNIGADNFEIRFKEMYQVSKAKKRRVARRPKYQPAKSGQGTYTGASASQSVGAAHSGNQSPGWKFDGNSGKWHSFKKSSGCSVSSDDIQAHFQSNPRGSMSFTINGRPYKLDFSALTQTNLTTRRTRRIKCF